MSTFLVGRLAIPPCNILEIFGERTAEGMTRLFATFHENIMPF
jgi:hypothetical protein